MTDKKEILFRCGKELFSSKGFKDTNVSDITEMAGFATGTFYNYYPSKEKLFMEIYREENAKLKRSILETVDLEGDPVDVMKEMMRLNLQGMIANPILREWYNKDVFGKIEQSFCDEKGHGHVNFMYDNFFEVIKKQQNAGKIRNDIDCGMIMAIFAALVNIDAHKEEIGLQYFPQVLDYIAEFVMKGLTQCPDKE